MGSLVRWAAAKANFFSGDSRGELSTPEKVGAGRRRKRPSQRAVGSIPIARSNNRRGFV